MSIPHVATLPFNEQEVNSLAKLRSLIGDYVMLIIKQTELGDPDWLWDIVSELDNIEPESPCFLKGFHDILQEAGYKSVYFDCDKINKEILDDMDLRDRKEFEAQMDKDEEEDMKRERDEAMGQESYEKDFAAYVKRKEEQFGLNKKE